MRARARAGPRGARQRARSSPRWAATGSPARSRASCATATGLLAVLPGGRGNDFARKLGIPFDPVEAAKLLADRRASARSTWPRPAARRYLGILSAGLRLRRQPDRARDAPEARHVRLHLRRAARDRSAGSAAAWDVTSTARPRAVHGYSVAVCNSGVFGGGMYLAPDAELDDGLLDVVMIAAPVQARATCAACRACSRARHLEDPAVELAAGPRGHLRRRPPVHRLRRRRPDRRAARDRPGAARRAAGGGAAMMRLAAGVAAAKAVGTLARTAGRGGGTSLPGQGAHARRAARDRRASRAGWTAAAS